MVRWEEFKPKRGIVPMYRQLALFIARQIKSGELAEGDQIPAERRLADMTGLSVDTVRAAMGVLREQGLVETGQGMGTFVTGRMPGESQSPPPG